MEADQNVRHDPSERGGERHQRLAQAALAVFARHFMLLPRVQTGLARCQRDFEDWLADEARAERVPQAGIRGKSLPETRRDPS